MIRRSMCEEFGKDLHKLAGHLGTIEEEYRTRTGRFARVPRPAELNNRDREAGEGSNHGGLLHSITANIRVRWEKKRLLPF